MREIKFRAINADGDWCYGLPYYDADGDLDMSLQSGYSDYGDIEKTLGQYTGLKDKNGFEIYEGDLVVDRDRDQPAIVEYREDNCCFMLSSNSFVTKECVNIFQYEVIGNIHQNPELLD